MQTDSLTSEKCAHDMRSAPPTRDGEAWRQCSKCGYSEPVVRSSNQCAAYGCQNKRNDGQFVGDYCGPCDSALRYGTATFGTSFIFQQQREIERLKTELGMRPAVCVCEPFCSRRNPKCPRCSTHETPEYRKWPGEPPHCMSCDCGMTDEQKRTVPEADYLRIHRELMDLKYPGGRPSEKAELGGPFPEKE